MMVSILIVDESTTGTKLECPRLVLNRSETSVREIIEARVRAEVDAYNVNKPDEFYGLVQPGDVESFLNGPRKRAFKKVSADNQVKVALEAFQQQRFIVLLPTGQANHLDQQIDLREGDEVSFLRLIPLIGG